jgi:4-oxalocrotonate tautomerase
MYAGRTEEQKQKLAASLVKAMQDALGVPETAISVSITDIPKAQWKETVYATEIMADGIPLYKKPGYTL